MLVVTLILWILIFGSPGSPPTESGVQASFENKPSGEVLDLEQNLFSEINGARAKHGLAPYLLSERLYWHAAQHSRRMAIEQNEEALDLSGFEEAPSSPNKISYWTRVTSSVLRVHADNSIKEIVDRLLTDEATRKNALSKEFNRGAIGLSRDRDGRLFITLLAGKEVAQESNLPLLEQKLFDVTNQARVERGLRPLQFSEQLSKIAREHSQEMALMNRLSHESRKGLGPADRLKVHRIKEWHAVAENVATNKRKPDPVKSTVDGWIAGPGHAANLFDPDFTQTGIGMAIAVDESYYFTQIFIR